MRLVSRIETIIANNNSITLPDNSLVYDCKIESSDIEASDSEYLVQFNFKCTHANSISYPTIAITAAEVVDGASSKDATLSLTFKTSPATTNFVVGDVSVSGGSLSSFSGSGTTYTATFTPTSGGATTIQVVAGKFTDYSGNKNTASDVFNLTYIETLANNYSILFDNTNEGVKLEGFPALSNTFSVSFWVKYTSLPTGSNYDNMISFGATGANRLFVLGRHNDDLGGGVFQQRLHVWDSVSTFYITSHTVEIDTWYNYVMVAKPTSDRLKFYINGDVQTFDALPSGDWNISGTSDAYLGRYHLANYSHIEGYMDEVAIFDTNLTDTDATEIYNSGTPNNLALSSSYTTDRTGDLVRYWRFEEGSGDSSNLAGTGDHDAKVENATYDTETPPN